MIYIYTHSKIDKSLVGMINAKCRGVVVSGEENEIRTKHKGVSAVSETSDCGFFLKKVCSK